MSEVPVYVPSSFDEHTAMQKRHMSYSESPSLISLMKKYDLKLTPLDSIVCTSNEKSPTRPANISIVISEAAKPQVFSPHTVSSPIDIVYKPGQQIRRRTVPEEMPF